MSKYEKVNGVKNSLVNDIQLFVKDVASDNLYSGVHVLQLGTNVSSQQNVRLTVDLLARKTFHNKLLKVKITDDNNPFFIYSLELNDEDYGHLKTLQGLLIDFCHFPNELISLLKKCNNQQEGSTRFFITFEENSGNSGNIKDEVILKVMETNCLKVLCHLALTLTPACIGDVKKEVLANITYFKETIQRHECNERESERKIQELVKNIDQRHKECEELRNQWDEQQRSWGISLSKQINEIREEYLKKQNDAELETRHKEEEMKLVHSRLVEQLAESLESLKIEKTHLTKSNLDLDVIVRNQNIKINSIEAKIDILEEDLRTSKYTLQEKIRDIEMKETTIKTLKTRLSNTDKLLIESTKKHSALESVVEELTKEKSRLSNMLKVKEQTILNNNDHLKSVCGDLVKANSIIRQLQRNNNLCKMKLDKALQYFQEQTTKLVKCSEQLHAMKEASEAKKKELDYLQKTAMSTNDTLKELKKDLLSTKQMTRLHDKEIMDLKHQPVTRDYKINGHFRKQYLDNVYLSRPNALVDCDSNQIESNKTSGEKNIDVIQGDSANTQEINSPPVFKTLSESVKEVSPNTSETQTQNQRQISVSKRPNIPVVGIGDETKSQQPVSKPQTNSLPVSDKISSKSIGIRRALINKTTDYKLGSYFQKTKLKKP